MAQAKASNLIGVEEAKRQHLVFDDPPNKTCEYCGGTLAPLGVGFNGKLRWICTEECTCEGVIQAKKEAETARKTAHAQEVRARYLSCGIRKRFLDAVIDSPQANRYLSGFGQTGNQGLYIYGEVGRGKTYMASALAKEFIRFDYSVVFASSNEILSCVQETFNNNDSTATALERFTNCDILFIDDIGKESSSQWTIGTIFQIINTRYENMKATVITSQFSLGELCVRFSKRGEREAADAIVSRLAETCEVMHLVGPDRRTKLRAFDAERDTRDSQ